MAAKKFEEAMERLEKIVQDLEEGELPLEDSLKIFEEGMNLVRFCSQELESAEKKVHLLVQESDGKLTRTPFEFDGEKDEG